MHHETIRSCSVPLMSILGDCSILAFFWCKLPIQFHVYTRSSDLVLPYFLRQKHLEKHSRDQRPRSFWSAPRIATSGTTRFSEHAWKYSSRTFSQLDLTENPWIPRRPADSSQFLVLNKRSVALGDELNGLDWTSCLREFISGMKESVSKLPL